MSISYIFVVLLFGTSLATEQTVFSFTNGSFTVLERMDLSMDITYLLQNGSSAKARINLTQSATVDKSSSSVSANHASLVIDLGELHVTNITQNFEAGKDTFSMKSMSLGLTFDDDIFPNAKEIDAVVQFTDEQFVTALGSSYSCNAPVTVESEKTSGATNATLTFSNMQLQPFGVKGNNFSKAMSCPEDEPSTTQATDTTTEITNLTTEVTTIMTTATTTPAPKAVANHLNFTYKGSSCILELMNATFQVDKKNVTTKFPMENAKVLPSSSQCGDKAKKTAAKLVAEWKDGDKTNNITQVFALEKDYYYLHSVIVSLTDDSGTEVYNFSLPVKTFLRTKFDSSLKCDSDQVAKYIGKDKEKAKGNLTMTFSEVRFQAFDIKESNFSKEYACPADNPTPIPEPLWNNTISVTYPKNSSVCIKEVTNSTFVVNDNGIKTVFRMTDAAANNASVCGDKKNKTNAIVIAEWGDNRITQTFAVSDEHYFMKNVTLYLKRGKKVYNHSFGLKEETLFYTPFGSSLICKSNQSTILKVSDTVNITMSYSDVKFQAYDINATSSEFSTREYTCSADNKMSNIVPIAVGAALAVLVIIVLIAYLIGRRNSSRAGYESV